MRARIDIHANRAGMYAREEVEKDFYVGRKCRCLYILRRQKYSKGCYKCEIHSRNEDGTCLVDYEDSQKRRFKNYPGAYYNCEIISRNEDGTYAVDYEDGDKDLSVEWQRLHKDPN